MLRLLDDSFPFRLSMAIVAATLLLAGVNRWEQCRSHGFEQGCLRRDAGGILSVGNIESLSIVSAALLYVLEGGRRRRRENIEAMEVILACQQAGARLSHARNDALQQLSEAGLWLDGLDLSETQLEELQAAHARWRGVKLQGADLRRACLHDADLQGSDLSGADLSGADLCHADLRGVNLRGARLWRTDLRGADLQGADLEGAELDGADLRGCRLELSGPAPGDGTPSEPRQAVDPLSG
ncbi:MAG: hypothetical protein RLZZ219_1179 [Cyanobacteriota bacterium]|jgi:type II secretory pathway pseudopilin PulG